MYGASEGWCSPVSGNLSGGLCVAGGSLML